MMVMRICVMIGRRMTYPLQMYTQRQRTTGPKQKNKWDQDRSPITGNNHSKSIEEAGMSQSRRYTWRAQPQRHALRHLTIITMFFLKTYICLIWREIAIRKGSYSTFSNVDCSTLQTSRPNHPTTYTHTYTHTNNSQSMHSFIHSFIQSIHHIHSITLSQERTKHDHCHSSQSTIIHPSTMPVSYTHLRAHET